MEPSSVTERHRADEREEATRALDGIVEAESVGGVLRDAVRGVLSGRNGASGSLEVVSVAVPTERVHPLHWLRAQEPAARAYWRGRDDPGSAVACLGVADAFTGGAGPRLERFRHESRSLLASMPDGVGYFGGSAFGSGPLNGEWQGFPRAWFMLPRFELRTSSLDSTLICNLVLPRDRRQLQPILGEIERLRMPALETKHALPDLVTRIDAPERPQWIDLVTRTLALMQGPKLDKVVLARKSSFEFSDPVDPYLLLERLEAATPGCFHFLLGLPESGTFLGASPERLFRRVGRRLDSEAVAGTRPRGENVLDDRRLRDELLLSEKERREHRYVERCIRENLEPLCGELKVDAQASEMALARGRHLYSRIQGVLQPGVTDFDLLDSLHPTPAVGGYPTAPALDVLREFEPFERGWYAGPIGWMRRDASEFAVGIRAGLVRGAALSLYSGAGIVPGSEPESEWNEIEHKIGDFTNVLGLDLQRSKY